MSTRANIIMKDKDNILIFYRHCDGYPDGTLPTLKKFMSWVRSGRIRDNVDQAAGWLILIGAKEYEDLGEDGRVKKPDLTVPGEKDNLTGWQCGSYEPTTRIHGDIEYLYTLDLEQQTIIVQRAITRPNGTDAYKTIETITDFTVIPEPAKNTPMHDYTVLEPDELEIV